MTTLDYYEGYHAGLEKMEECLHTLYKRRRGRFRQLIDDIGWAAATIIMEFEVDYCKEHGTWPPREGEEGVMKGVNIVNSGRTRSGFVGVKAK